MELIGQTSPVVYSELVVLYDPSLRYQKRKQRILVMTTTSFHILLPEYPYERCDKRDEEIPLLWIEKLYADRIDGQIIFQIRADYDLWLELPTKTHFIHLFSILHKLLQKKEKKQVNLEVQFVFDIETSPDAIYISKNAAKKTKEYISAKERVLREAESTVKNLNSSNKSKKGKSPKMSNSQKKKGFGFFSSFGDNDSKKSKIKEAKKVEIKMGKIRSPTKKMTKEASKSGAKENKAASLDSIELEMESLHFNKEIIEEAMKVINKILKAYEKRQKSHIKKYTEEYAKEYPIEFDTFDQRVFSNYEFEHFPKDYVTSVSEDVFMPIIYLSGKEYSVRKFEIRPGILSNEQKYLLGIESDEFDTGTKKTAMKYKGAFEYDEKTKSNMFAKKDPKGIRRFKYYFMERVDINLEIMLNKRPSNMGLPYNYVVSISKQILQLFFACHTKGYSLVGLTLRDIYLVKDANDNFNQIKVFNFNRFKGMSCEVMREELRFEDICTCPKELLAQAFLQYDAELLNVSPEMEFWTYGVILYRLLTGEYPYPEILNALEPAELYDRLVQEQYNPSVYINQSNIDHPPAKFLLRKLLGQDPANLDMETLLKDDFFDQNSTSKDYQDY